MVIKMSILLVYTIREMGVCIYPTHELNNMDILLTGRTKAKKVKTHS